MARQVGGPPPADERFPRSEGELAPLTGLEQEVVEAVKGDIGRLDRGRESVPYPVRRQAHVVPDNHDPVLLRLPDPLARRFRDRLEGGVVVHTDEWQRDPVARRLDLRDGVEADCA